MRNIFVLLFFIFACQTSSLYNNEIRPVITMKRTACYGTCPQYIITIYKDGKTIYEGINFVDKIGRYQSYLTQKDVKNILTNIDEVSFFELDDYYDSPITDVPSVILKVDTHNKTHKVIDRFNGPKSLKNIYKLIDYSIDCIIEWDTLMIQ